MRVLIAEHSTAEMLVLQNQLRRMGHEVSSAQDGLEALARVEGASRADGHGFELVIVDWFMPRMDGIELVRRLRERPDFEVPILFLMEPGGERATAHVVAAGADDCLHKPVSEEELVRRVDRLTALTRPDRERAPDAAEAVLADWNASPAPFPAVCLAASTGGPDAVARVVESLQRHAEAVVFVVVHAPVWMLEQYQLRLQRVTDAHVVLATPGGAIEPGMVVLAPGGYQTMVDPREFETRLEDDPEEHFVRPAADPLLRSAAVAFGSDCLGVVLTGLGRDGAAGARWIHDAGGRILVQDPEECVARSMPLETLAACPMAASFPVSELAPRIDNWIDSRSRARVGGRS